MLDRKLIEPTARVYAKGDRDRLPGKIRARVRNFFTNWLGPIDITNNLLQGQFKQGFSGVGRMLVNSTIGFGGLFDPASRWGMPRYPEDFGQTFASWGVPPGPYLYLPLFGPRNARDLVGLILDWQINPITQYDDTSTRNGLFVVGVIDRRTDAFPLDYQRERQPDPYIFDLDTYSDRRFRDIWYDGDAPPNLEIYR
jgi:phospholipid-binding lipoprotein MlaA